MHDAFSVAVARMEREDVPPALFSSSFVELFPVSGATVSTVGNPLGSETVSATDDVAAHIDELQFDLGEGPCWDAVRTADPVVMPDFSGQGPQRWPRFAEAALAQSVTSIFAFPLSVGTLRLGAVDLYSVASPVTLTSDQCRQAIALSNVIGRRLLTHALRDVTNTVDVPEGPFSRRALHQATGMVLAQLDVAADDALLVIQAHAFARGVNMMEVADDIVRKHLSFVRVDGRIESRP